MSELRVLATPHIIKVYEESISGITRREIATLTVYTHNSVSTPLEHRDRLRIEVS